MSRYNLDAYAGKDIVFVGAGKGRAMAGIKHFLEANATIKSFTGIDKQSGAGPLDFLLTYDTSHTIFIKNEAIPGSEMPVPYVTPLQLFFEVAAQTKTVIIGITGTKGKSTTAALTAHMLQTAGKPAVLAGNIGVSPLALLDSSPAEAVFVLELSSYQLADLRVSPHISACTNLFNDHSDWHGSKADYWEAKHNIMRFATAEDMFIYNPQFAELQAWAKQATCQTMAINPEEPVNLSRSALFGDHNRLNALIARAIATYCGVPEAASQSALDSFQPLAHRMQFVDRKHDKTYIDDAIGMTPESTMASLQAVTTKYGPIGCLLLGGQDRNYDFRPLLQQVAKHNIPKLVLFPDTVAKMRAALPDGYGPDILEASTMAEAVQFAAKVAPADSVVLLSTGAPSYSLWKDFEDKGDQFQHEVNAL